jgi:regulator of protease activity HflC (stomatin/prohibitin superfamily)
MPRDSRNDNPQPYTPPAEARGSGAGTAVLIVLLGLIFVVGPFFAATYITIPLVSQIAISGFGVVMLVGVSIMFAITQLYERATMNEAFVRTGVGGPKVVVDGAAIFIPAIHRITRVSLETIRLEIERTGDKSFITGDSLHVDVKAQFYIRVNREESAIKAAATSLGGKSGVDQMIMDLVGDKLISGLRTVAGRKELDFLHAHVDAYSEEVKKIVEEDLAHNGLFLESVTVTYLNQTSLSNLKPEENIFDALGARKIATVTNEQRVEIAKVKTAADQQVKQQEVARDQELFKLQVQRETAEALTNQTIANAKAEADRKAAEFKAEQEQLSKVAQVASAQAVELANVEKTKTVSLANAQQEQEVKTRLAETARAVQTAEVLKEQAVQTAAVQKEQAVSTANVEKQKTVEIKQREQQIAVADAERRRAEAQTAQIAAETERTRKDQEQQTVAATAKAEREKAVALLNKESAVKQDQIEKNTQADIDAYRTMKIAEAGKQAAQDEAEAARLKATGQKDAKTLEAEGEQAKAMVAVNVNRAQVEVQQKEVEVEKTRLENQERFGKAGIELQVRLRTLEMVEAIGRANAEMVGKALQAADLTFYGDATTFHTMLNKLAEGQAAGKYLEGLVGSVPPEVKTLTFDTINRFCQAAAGLLEKFGGPKLTPEALQKLVEAEMEKQTTPAAAAATNGNN